MDHLADYIDFMSDVMLYLTQVYCVHDKNCMIMVIDKSTKLSSYPMTLIFFFTINRIS